MAQRFTNYKQATKLAIQAAIVTIILMTIVAVATILGTGLDLNQQPF